MLPCAALFWYSQVISVVSFSSLLLLLFKFQKKFFFLFIEFFIYSNIITFTLINDNFKLKLKLPKIRACQTDCLDECSLPRVRVDNCPKASMRFSSRIFSHNVMRKSNSYSGSRYFRIGCPCGQSPPSGKAICKQHHSTDRKQTSEGMIVRRPLCLAQASLSDFLPVAAPSSQNFFIQH